MFDDHQILKKKQNYFIVRVDRKTTIKTATKGGWKRSTMVFYTHCRRWIGEGVSLVIDARSVVTPPNRREDVAS